VNESTVDAQTSRLARASSRLGVFALLILVLSHGCILLLPTSVGRSGLQGPTQEGVIPFSLVEVFCEGLAVIAALAAFVLGILGLVLIRRGGGRVSGRWRAVTGLVTSILTVLTLVLMYGVVKPALTRNVLRLESSNNLKQLGLAIMNYSDSYAGRLPPAVLRDHQRLGDRAQPYSWRVALLPFLGEENLFSQYRRDEPWDSPANKAVLARMPQVFATPGSVRAADGLTHYQVLVGPGTAFERPDMRLSWSDLARGGAQTILVVEAAVPVPWTKPEDLSYAPDGPLPKVGGLMGNGFHALFADASVRWIEAEQEESALRTLVPLKGR
jgi:hypothetical protein